MYCKEYLNLLVNVVVCKSSPQQRAPLMSLSFQLSSTPSPVNNNSISGHMTHRFQWLISDHITHLYNFYIVVVAHRLSLPRLLPESIATVTLVWVPSLCVVRADYKLARQFPPELSSTGTELEQQRSMPYRSQISHWYRSKLPTG